MLSEEFETAVKLGSASGTSFTTNIGTSQGSFFVDLQYTDDIGLWAGNHTIGIEQQKLQILNKLEDRNLNINLSKTKEYIINRENKDGAWKKCIYLGTLFKTERDIKKRKHSACAAFHCFKHMFNDRKLHVSIKPFQCPSNKHLPLQL